MHARSLRQPPGVLRMAGLLLLAAACACPISLGAQPSAPERSALVNNVWTDTPLVQVLSDISAQVGVTITADPTVADLPVSLEAHNTPLLECLAKVTLGKGLALRQVEPGHYVVGSDRPGSLSFTVVSESRRITLKYVTARHVKDSLPTDLRPYVTNGERTTEMIVFGPPEKLERILALVREMDVPVPQVVLEALVVELSRESGKEAGIDWEIAGRNVAIALTDGANAFTGATRYASVNERDYTTIVTSVKLLVSNGKAKIRSRPRVATLNGTPATIDASLEEFFAIVTDVNNNLLRTELRSVKSGVVLKMTPQVGGEGDITLHVETEVSDVVSRRNSVVRTDGTMDTLPVIRRRKAESQIRVKDGDAIVIGGLIESQVRDEVRRVPVLGYIPLLGALFTTKKSQNVEKEVIIFIKPHVMTGVESADAGGHTAINVAGERNAFQTDPTAEPATGEPL